MVNIVYHLLKKKSRSFSLPQSLRDSVTRPSPFVCFADTSPTPWRNLPSKKKPKTLPSHSVCHLPLKGTAIASLIEGGGFFASAKKTEGEKSKKPCSAEHGNTLFNKQIDLIYLTTRFNKHLSARFVL